MLREILHCDMNNFFASVECIDHPEWKKIPMAVCGKEEERHGIVLAKNEIAKKFGIKTGETIREAKEKCPALFCADAHYEKYVAVSRQAFAIYREYTDLVEPFGMDECWLDVTASRRLFGNGKGIADHLRRRIRKELGVTISCGVSYNKVFAKLGSDLKKPDATTCLFPEDRAARVDPLPVGMLFGVGRKAEEALLFYGIATIGALAEADERLLQSKFGVIGLRLKQAAAGQDHSPVLPDIAEPPMKSLSHGRTYPRDLATREEVRIAILSLSQEIGRKLRLHRKAAKGVEITLKDRDFFLKQLRRRLPAPTDCTAVIANCACALFFEEYPFLSPLRAVTVSAVGLERAEALQLSLFQDAEELKQMQIDRLTDSLCARHGKNALFRASLLPEISRGEPEDPHAFHFPAAPPDHGQK